MYVVNTCFWYSHILIWLSLRWIMDQWEKLAWFHSTTHVVLDGTIECLGIWQWICFQSSDSICYQGYWRSLSCLDFLGLYYIAPPLMVMIQGWLAARIAVMDGASWIVFLHQWRHVLPWLSFCTAFGFLAATMAIQRIFLAKYWFCGMGVINRPRTWLSEHPPHSLFSLQLSVFAHGLFFFFSAGCTFHDPLYQ